MTKFTKFTAAIVAAAAVLSFAGCSNNNTSSENSSTVSTADAASTAEVKTAEAAATAEATTAQASATAEADTAATAEAAAFDVTKMYGSWILAAVNNGTDTMNVADFAASTNATVEEAIIAVVIDENNYSSKAANSEGTYSYVVTENGITVDVDGVELPVFYDEESDSLAYGVATGDVTYKFIFIRNTDDAAASTAQASATAEAAVAATVEG